MVAHRRISSDEIIRSSRQQFCAFAVFSCSRKECDEEGAAMVEFAMVFPIFMGLIIGFLVACMAFYTYCMISDSAREGARWAATRGATCQTTSGTSCTATAAQIQTYTQDLGWPNLSSGTVSATATFPSGNQNQGSLVQVTVTYTFPWSIPVINNGSNITLSSTASMPILQ